MIPDSAHAALLSVHVAAGATALVCGPAAVVASLRRLPQRSLTIAYQTAVAAVTASALALVALAPARLWWLAPIAVATEAAAVGGWWLAHRGSAVSGGWQIRLLGGSYVSLVTALLVVSWGTWAAWALPTIVGVVLIEAATLPRGRRLLLSSKVGVDSHAG